VHTFDRGVEASRNHARILFVPAIVKKGVDGLRKSVVGSRNVVARGS
jgi:hypothetical protein